MTVGQRILALLELNPGLFFSPRDLIRRGLGKRGTLHAALRVLLDKNQIVREDHVYGIRRKEKKDLFYCDVTVTFAYTGEEPERSVMVEAAFNQLTLGEVNRPNLHSLDDYMIRKAEENMPDDWPDIDESWDSLVGYEIPRRPRPQAFDKLTVGVYRLRKLVRRVNVHWDESVLT